MLDANPVMGQLAFEQSCSGCHASRDGFDLKTFSFTDTTIIRRAVKHVDTATARDIVAYIHGLSAPPNNKDVRLFQPRGAPLAGDMEFAVALFGRDSWPADMTTAQLLAIDPRNVQIAARLPVWADETSNMDWMPDSELPGGILDYSGGLARGAIAGYHAAPTADNLVRAVNALRTADRAPANPQAPCLLEDTLRVRYRECFEVRRWTSSLVALYMLRNGMNAQCPLPTSTRTGLPGCFLAGASILRCIRARTQAEVSGRLAWCDMQRSSLSEAKSPGQNTVRVSTKIC
jgi:hypothetical protein